MMIELMLSIAPYSKKIQDLASKFGVTKQRFKPRNEECVSLRALRPDMRGTDGRPGDRLPEPRPQAKDLDAFRHRSEECRLCGGCMYICPACQLRCQGPQAETDICNACLTMDPTCLDAVR